MTTLTRSITAASEALFPSNDAGAPDWQATEMVPRTLAYLDLLPRAQRKLIVLMFVTIEWACPLLAPGLGRFSRRSPERRLRAVRRWRRSRIYLVRYLGDSLKAMLTMMYLSHPAAIRHIGAFKTCDAPSDPLSYDPAPAGFTQGVV